MPLQALYYSRYCRGGTPEGETLIPIAEFQTTYGISRCHVQTLLRRRALVALKFKKRYYVNWHPEVREEFRHPRFWKLRGIGII